MYIFFVSKQKTAYDMRISDWSSDVCSSDLTPEGSIFDGRHIQDIARFDPGDRYDATDVDDLHPALIQTGLVSSADIKPVQGSTPATVEPAITMAPPPPPTNAGELGEPKQGSQGKRV